MYNCTSEDNASFDTIVEKTNEKHREKFPYLYEKTDQTKMLEYTSKLPGRLISWESNPRNALMNNVSSLETLVSEPEDKESTKKILHNNTRFNAPIFTSPQNIVIDKSDTTEELMQKKIIGTKKFDLDDLLGSPKKEEDTPSFNGYKLVTAPSPSPEEMDPIFTWGTVEDTSIILDPDDNVNLMLHIPLDGPEFKVPETSKKELVALSLAQKAVDSMKERTKRTNSSRRTPQRKGTISKAGQNLKSRLTKTPIFSELRASYGTPLLKGSTPKRNKLKTPITPRFISTPKKNLTDNLL